ncbi:MAG: DNA polymerase III subunit gamma/tau [Pseudomonadota bacterium]
MSLADTSSPDTPIAEPAPYKVLARKYRPSHFGELIGQAPMVRTLRNAFAAGRIAQAWMLTGVRGVGKTTTARILARALNYETADGRREPTVDLETPGVHCQAIMEGRHVDVIEMDAASHTGIDSIRDLTDAARYAPVSAPYKVYIIDEVHMLSTAACNGLLKTLEEPPAHVKFLFATTEIRKVPVTILSRCQRFDLRRVEHGELVAHLSGIAEKEGISASDEALAMVARAAEGSVRDALSLLDQAIAHGGGAVDAGEVRVMLGLADRTRVLTLFEAVAGGDAAAALQELSDQYTVGADPLAVLTDLANLTHAVTRLKVTGMAPDEGDPQALRERAAALAQRMGTAALSRLWQAMLTGLTEVQFASKSIVAAEMVLIRLCYLAGLPDPADLVNGAPGGVGGGPSASAAPSRGGGATALGPTSAPHAVKTVPATSAVAPAGRSVSLPSFRAVAELLADAQELALRRAVEQEMRLKRFEAGRIEVSMEPTADQTVAGRLGAKLTALTGMRWVVIVSDGADAATLAEEDEAEQARLKADAANDPLVRATLDAFPDATIERVTVRRRTEHTSDAEPEAGTQEEGRSR